jgi:hypothetical protein
MKIVGHRLEPLVVWWTIGLVIAYLFLISLILWLIFQGILLYQAFISGNMSYIEWKLSRYLFIAIIYFAIAGFLRLVRFI